ncbi:ATP-dependent DNA ligase [soil metagenome]
MSDAAALAPLVAASRRLVETPGRNDKIAIIAEVLGVAASDGGGQAGLAAAYLAGDPPQDRMEVGWATVRDLDVAPATAPALTLTDVDAALTALTGASGAGSRAARQSVLTDLLGTATAEEQAFLTHLILGDLRQGALEGLVVKGIAAAAGVPETVVRRALMLSADLVGVTAMAFELGREGLEAVGLTVGQGVQPMLASTAASVGVALAELGTAVVEWKLDGARIQVHKDGNEVTVLTRNLNDVTERSPAVVARHRALPATTAVLDGEVLAVGEDGRPRAFQDTMSAFSAESADELVGRLPMRPFFFDLLHLDGEDLLDLPLTERRRRLHDLVDPDDRIPSEVVTDAAAGQAILEEALDRGHEGVMVKALDAPYAAGRRGKAWRKVKPVTTLDLVVLAVEWGSGRRQGLLSNIHLGAREDRPGQDGFVMLGKTFKGMTDAVLSWQTQRFLDLETHRDGHVVHVRPEQVVEIAIDGLQTSTRYPGGVALRFARLVRYRDDKAAAQADSLGEVLAQGRRPT